MCPPNSADHNTEDPARALETAKKCMLLAQQELALTESRLDAIKLELLCTIYLGPMRKETYGDCVGRCIQKNDPLDKLIGSMLASGGTKVGMLLGGVWPKTLAKALGLRTTGLGGAGQTTTILSMISSALRMPASNPLRSAGRIFAKVLGPVATSYGLYMAGVIVGCLTRCAAEQSGLDVDAAAASLGRRQGAAIRRWLDRLRSCAR